MKRLFSIIFCLMLIQADGFSETIAASNSDMSGPNFLIYFMAGVAIVLLFVIWGLGNILLAYAKKIGEKEKPHKEPLIPVVILAILLLSGNKVSAESALLSVNYGGLSSTTFYMLTGVISVEFLVIFFLVLQIRKLHRELYAPVSETIKKTVEAKKESRIIQIWHNLDRRFFTKAAEKDTDVLLDHDYDGIRELDNALPPWWKYGFFVTIFIGAIYMYRFHISGSGPSPEQEYAVEMIRADEELKEYIAKAKDLVDEASVSYDAAGIETGKALYAKSCIACHGAAGEGGVGPNLTDVYWLHGGSMKDIFKTIKYGYPEKGMQSWQQQYSPKQMQQMASFIFSLKGSNPPNGKPAQGEKYEEQKTGSDSVSVDNSASSVVINQ
jgi:cytochrome c oxidase cbb3-type subunit 3